MARRVGYFLLLLPFPCLVALYVGFGIFRDLKLGCILAAVAAVLVAYPARLLSQRQLSIWTFRGWIAAATFAWVGVAGLSAVGIAAWSIDQHLKYGTDWCWQSPDIQTTSCRGRDHSFMQGRLSYVELLGTPRGTACAELVRGSTKVPCPQLHRKFVRMKACPDAYREGWLCFSCEHLSESSDWRRIFYFLRADCREAAAWYSENVTLEEMPKALAGKLYP